jgi:hypothetical protein
MSMDESFIYLIHQGAEETMPLNTVQGYRDPDYTRIIIPESSYDRFCKILYEAIAVSLLEESDIAKPLVWYADCMVDAFVDDHLRNGNPYDYLDGDEVEADEIRAIDPDAELHEDLYFYFEGLDTYLGYIKEDL